MMPSALKRKGSPSLEDDAESSKRRFAESEETPRADAASEDPAAEDNITSQPEASELSEPAGAASVATAPANDRAARFAALRARNQTSRKENLKETRNESRRAAVDPSQLASIHRKKDIAQHKLLKADTEASGEDFERKRAWDWTAEESARWDARMAEKKRKREEVGFADYSREAGKVYERQIGEMTKRGGGGSAGNAEGGWEERKEAYERSKREAIDAAVRSGGLEIVETETGELIAVDKDGSFFSTSSAADSSTFGNKPSKASVDRLVKDIKKAEEVRLKKRRERGIKDADDGGDVTFINEKNKQFNQKLARFYDKYTADIRESFERGTAI